MPLYHFSEDPGISRFEPRAPLARPEIEPLVWAIDEWHAPMYFFPRDCPRACFWPGHQTTDEDRDRWCGYLPEGARMVIAIESRWLPAVREAALYRYELPERTFVPNDDTAGHWVSRESVEPLSVSPVGDLLLALNEATVEIRVTPSLVALWISVVESTLSFSGTRLRNAVGYADIESELWLRGRI